MLKIDRVTLSDRVELLAKQHDIAQSNYTRELNVLSDLISSLDKGVVSSSSRLSPSITNLKKSVQVLAVAVESVLSAVQEYSGAEDEIDLKL